MKATSVSQENLDRYARVGLWALPLYGLANFIGTLSSQPDYKKDFPGYARYISTSPFVASHLVASIFGAGIGILGFTALFVYLVRGSDRPGIALAAFVMTIVGSMGLVALFGVAAFAQRAIGKALPRGGSRCRWRELNGLRHPVVRQGRRRARPVLCWSDPLRHRHLGR